MVIIPVILAGGSGSRLWPMSRESRPKYMHSLITDQSMLQDTVDRAGQLSEIDELFIVSNVNQGPNIQHLMQAYGGDWTMIVEPVGRNTTGAIALAAKEISQRYGQHAMMVVLSADHHIPDSVAFGVAIKHAVTQAEKGYLVTLGLKPQSADTGFGYIESGQPVGMSASLVTAFHEKPTVEKAVEYIHSGMFFWNAGIFVFKAGIIRAALKEHCHPIYSATEVCSGQRIGHELRISKETYQRVPSNSIDYAVMEKAIGKLVMIHTEMEWDDLGSWESVGKYMNHDEHGNAIEGQVQLFDTKDSIIWASTNEKLIVGLGLENIVIAETRDALLVSRRDNAQDVKKVYEALLEDGHPAAKKYMRVEKPWGWYRVLCEHGHFKVKLLVVFPGHRLSLQKHVKRVEQWVIAEGTAVITKDDLTREYGEGQTVDIPVGCIHRISNETDRETVIVETQLGDYLGEDDIIRFEDDYGRSVDQGRAANKPPAGLGQPEVPG